MIIVIDGPAGSGKSTTAKAVAEALDIEYLDSGSLYRAMTWLYIQTDQDEKVFFRKMDKTSISFVYADNEFQVTIDGKEITDKLRRQAVDDLVSSVASLPRLRTFVNGLMHEAVQERRYIAEGRDLGTVVFPNAEVKFFMVADADERARRRHKELKEAGADVSLNKVRNNISSRDEKDAGRDADPLEKASDAIEIDTTIMNFEEQVQRICSIISNKTALNYKP
jgi:cytidylate kinase